MKKKLITLGALTAIVASIAVPASFAAAQSSAQDSVATQSITIQSTYKTVIFHDENNKYGKPEFVPPTYSYYQNGWYGELPLLSTTYSNGLYYGNYKGTVMKVE
ncbi:hypothetical protein [Paenibacillus sp. PAMC 26794]|uniref:hypothetical protein n=1 Tax=Paenibacillus sp. PAMC 26794 TaxID=1257080 RepID=UPI00031FF0CB|nr:hypothetical protein [Paenibacillus sp. PAMC 26794]